MREDPTRRLGTILTAEMLLDTKAPDGSIWIKYNADGRGHTGFVYDHDPKTNTLKSIEGNASDKVKAREYIITNIDNFKGVIL